MVRRSAFPRQLAGLGSFGSSDFLRLITTTFVVGFNPKIFIVRTWLVGIAL
jgi:hypothetical protein